MGNMIVIGIDQSYKDTGVSVSFNNRLKIAKHIHLEGFKNNSQKRCELQKFLFNVFSNVHILARDKQAKVIVVIERIRLRSQGFINIDYIKSIGALNALIVDTAGGFDYPVYSVDTRAWKSAVVGTSKGEENKYGFDSKKWPTITWCINNGYKGYIKQIVSNRKQKSVFEYAGERFTYNDNIADSICISLFPFRGSKEYLKEEH